MKQGQKELPQGYLENQPLTVTFHTTSDCSGLILANRLIIDKELFSCS